MNWNSGTDGWSAEPYLTKLNAPAPAISSVSPSSYPASNSNQTMTINGSNFVNGATLTFTIPNGSTINSTAAKLTFVSGNRIDYQFNNGSDAGTWNVRVNNPDGQQSSNRSFTVAAAPAPAVSVVLSSPDGGETYQAGQSQTISWGAAGNFGAISKYYLDYSTQSGTAGTFTNFIATVNHPTSTYSWTIPGGINSGNVRVRVRAADSQGNVLGTDTSNANFTITTGTLPPPNVSITEPLSGAAWVAGTTRTIRWAVSGNDPPQISYFLPEVSVDGSNFTAMAQVGSSIRQASWNLPSQAVSSQARIRIKALNAAGQVLDTATSAPFNIVAPAVAKPNAVISANWDAVSGSPTSFKGDQSTASAAGETITNYRWEFGDGAESTAANPQHTFTAVPGSKFTVKLTVTDSLGKTDTESGTITIGVRTLSTNTQQAYSPDPVNLATGNYTYEHTDVRLPGVGLPFEFKRYYNSRGGRFNGPPLGHGWTHSYNEHVIENADGSVSVLRGDGNLDTYTVGAGGTFVPESGIHNELSKTADGRYVLTGKDEVRREFDASRRLAVIRDRNSNTVQLTYAADGTIDKFTDSAGRTIEVTSDASGRIISLADSLGRTVALAYDGNGDLVSSTDRRGGVTLFTYDANHQILTTRDPRGTVFVTNTYDSLQRVVTAQHDALGGETKFEYDFVSRVTTMTDALGNKSYHRHDDRLRVNSVTDARGNTEFFEYDADNNRVKVTDKRGAVATYSYDARGNVTGKTDPLGKKTTIQYDPRNRPLLRRDATGATTRFTYDARGNLISTTNPLGFVTRAEYDARGLAVRLTDALGRVSQQSFDPAGNLLLMTDALLNVTQYEYDAVGRRTAMVDARTARTTYEYDAEDHPTKTTDPLGHVSTTTYDANGNRTEITDQRGNKTEFTYDVKDRLTRVEDALGNVTQHTYDALDRKTSTIDARGHTTTFSYDAVGNLIELKDARNNETWFAYDANGNRISVTNALGQTSWTDYDPLNRAVRSGDPLGSMTNIRYDAVGRKVLVTDALGRNTSFKYDVAGRLIRVTDAAGGSVRFTYDKAGNRLTQTDQRGRTTRYAYDAMNRLIQMREPMGGITTHTYDAVGNRVKKVDPNEQETQFFYGLRRTLDRILYSDASEVLFTYDPAGNRITMTDRLGNSTWQYDALGRVTLHADPFGQSLGYGYDAIGNRTTITYPGNKTVTYTFDEVDRMTAVTDWDARTTTYSYDPAGRPIGSGNPNGTAAALTYDLAGRVIELTHTGPADAVIARYGIALDAVGNHRHVEHTEPLQAFPPEEDTTYSYDKDNRLVRAGNVTFAYDPNGNTTRRAADTFGYDASDRLATASVGGEQRTFSYDGLGNRFARTVGGTTTRFVLDLNSGLSRILCETDGSNIPTAYYVYGLNLVSRVGADGSVRYYHGDVRGSTVALTDAAGAVTDKYAYDEFGVALGQEGMTANPFRFLGRAGIYDEGNDLLHVRARYYTPSLGRFFSKDSFPASDEDGRTLHRYVYALNNPSRFVDYSGFAAQEAFRQKALSTSSDAGALNNYLIEAEYWNGTADVLSDTLYALSQLSLEVLKDAPEWKIVYDKRGFWRRVPHVGKAKYFAKALDYAGQALTLWDAIEGWDSELKGRGFTWGDTWQSVKDIDENIAFGINNPDILIDSLKDGVDSATAVTLDILSFGAFDITGQKVGAFTDAVGNKVSDSWAFIFGP